MANTLSPIELVSNRLDSINTAMDALFKHTTKAIDIDTRTNRTTISILLDLTGPALDIFIRGVAPIAHSLGVGTQQLPLFKLKLF